MCLRCSALLMQRTAHAMLYGAPRVLTEPLSRWPRYLRID